jgi:hypothetical protein
MMTSSFSNLKNIPAGMEPVAIAVGVPAWFKGRREPRLAPTRAMLKMSVEEYAEHFEAILAQLDPKEVYDSLGENAELLCWEAPGDRCHRRRVAEWLEQALGVTISEMGFDRKDVLAYDAMTRKEKPARRGRPGAEQLFLF